MKASGAGLSWSAQASRLSPSASRRFRDRSRPQTAFGLAGADNHTDHRRNAAAARSTSPRPATTFQATPTATAAAVAQWVEQKDPPAALAPRSCAPAAARASRRSPANGRSRGPSSSADGLRPVQPRAQTAGPVAAGVEKQGAGGRGGRDRAAGVRGRARHGREADVERGGERVFNGADRFRPRGSAYRARPAGEHRRTNRSTIPSLAPM